jgi:hypothetical protein
MRQIQRALGVPIQLVVVDGEPWRIELRPAFPATGLEVAAGVPCHGAFPERVAAYLRSAPVSD